MTNRMDFAGVVASHLKRSDVYFALVEYYKSQWFVWQLMALVIALEEPPILELKKFIDRHTEKDLTEPYTGQEIFQLVKIVFSPDALKLAGASQVLCEKIRAYFPEHLHRIFIICLHENIFTPENYSSLLKSVAIENLLAVLVTIKKNSIKLSKNELNCVRLHSNPESALQAFIILNENKIQVTDNYLLQIKLSQSPAMCATEIMNSAHYTSMNRNAITNSSITFYQQAKKKKSIDPHVASINLSGDEYLRDNKYRR